MITQEQLNFVNSITGKSRTAKLRTRQSEIEMEAKLAQLEAEDEALIAWLDEVIEESTVEVLLDEVKHTEKPQAKEVGRITRALPNNRIKVTIPQFARFIERGCSFKASILTSTTKDSFVSSNIVALDIDNKESYTSIANFMAQTKAAGLKPFMLYETFSSTPEHERYRVLYRFNKTITDAEEMEKLYNYVWSLFPQVDLDYSVDHSKILYGGKNVVFHNIEVNEVPDLSNVSFIKKQTKVAQKQTKNQPIKQIAEAIEITELDIAMNLEKIAPQFKDIRSIDINESEEWINTHVKMTDVLGIEENVRFRCILPKHEDKNPSARITTYDNKQTYMCSCEANGYTLITLLSKLLPGKSRIKIKKMILKALNITLGSEYQREAERYIAELRRHLPELLGDTVLNYLQGRKLYQIYRLIIDFADAHIAYESFSKDDDRLVFFLSKRELIRLMDLNQVPGTSEASRKISSLCELGLLKALPDSEIKKSVLKTAYQKKEKIEKVLSKNSGKTVDLNRCSFYELVDPSQLVIAYAESVIKMYQDLAVRQRGMNANRRAAVLGEDVVTGSVNVQSSINSKKQDRIKNRVQEVSDQLLAEKKFYNEEELRKAYCRRDKNVTKVQAEGYILDIIPVLIQEQQIQRIRVNKTNRRNYKIPNSYKSNSFVYIRVA